MKQIGHIKNLWKVLVKWCRWPNEANMSYQELMERIIVTCVELGIIGLMIGTFEWRHKQGLILSFVEQGDVAEQLFLNQCHDE